MRGPGDTALLVGRDEELALVDALLARGRQQGDTLLLHGDPGVGKSALAAVAIARARAAGAHVLTTTGVPSEAELPYACLHQLLRPVMDEADALPAPQKTVLHAAMGMGDEPPKDPFRTGLAVLGLLGDAAERSPIVVVAEDAHWIDESTSEVLAFVARRIESDAIAMLFTSRDSIPRSLRGAGLPAKRLHPLSETAAEALLHTLDPRMNAAKRMRILQQAQGNPLGLVELLARAPEEPDLPAWLPLSTRLERTFAARVADLPQPTRTALLVAALTDRANVEEVLDAASRVEHTPLTLDVLTPAVTAGLVEVDELHLRFGHPLMRSAIGQSGPEHERRAAHAALAQTLHQDPARSLWHRVASTSGSDDALADELAAVSSRALKRGSIVTAAETLGRAAALTEQEPTRGARLLDAAELALDIGRDDLVERLLADAGPLVLAPADRPRRIWLQRISHRTAPEPAWFEAHVDRVDELRQDPARRSQALLSVAFRSWWSPAPAPLRERMIEQAQSLPKPAEPLAIVALSLVAPEQHGPQVRAWLDRIEPDAIPAELLRLAAVSGPIVGAFDRTVTLADAAVERLRARGRYGLLATALVSRAWAGVYTGGWSNALAIAENANVVSQETAQPLWSVASLAAAATLNGLRGDLHTALRLADESEATLPPGAADGMLSMVEYARGVALLHADRPAEALPHLARVLHPGEPWHTGFVARWAVADAAEAAAGANERAAGRAIVEHAASLPGPSRHLEASIAYARMLLEGQLDEHAEHALALTVELPALRGRVQLAYGRELRRRRRAGEARAALRAARDTFEALDMGSLADRARQELRAAGEAIRTAAVDPAAVLTPQELQIARMAADGLSNREIGQALYLSHRTIGSTLYRVFPKLQIAARSELRAVLQ